MRDNNNSNLMHGFQRSLWHGSGQFGHLLDAIRRPFTKSFGTTSYSLFFFFFVLLVVALVSTRLLDTDIIAGSAAKRMSSSRTHAYPHGLNPTVLKSRTQYPLNCTDFDFRRTCPRNYPTTFDPPDDPELLSSPMCPEYFRWIHEDLRPWAHTGITRETLESARTTANFRLVIVDGKAYVEQFQKSFQTRDVFTLWGILQLLRKYPGKVPDLELMFDCVDWPVIKAGDFIAPESPAPPPLFRYCSNDESLDIVFPDWTFWGWPETNIKPWEPLSKELKEGNKRLKWNQRDPHAFWKGNPIVAETRQDLLKCNVTEQVDWNARLYSQNWSRESQEGYKSSSLASQCSHRFKIYIEGSAWSVSEKYILACDSVTLLVTPHYYDFFTRGLVPVQHYWPIREDDKCKSIKFAVEWGNSHKKKARKIGREASAFIQDELKMDYVYDYMYHLLNMYAKLLRFKPRVPPGAVEYCAEQMACPATGLEKKFEMESLVMQPAETNPCTLPPPYDPPSLASVIWRKENSIKEVELWEKRQWDKISRQT